MSEKKKYPIYFYLVAMLIPVVFFVILEVFLHLVNYGGDLSLFISMPDEYSEYYRINREVGRRYFYDQVRVPDPANDVFLKRKPANGYRIFVLGASTSAGYPYGENLMFSRILHQKLSSIFPQKTIEVINTSIAAINSYTLLDFMDEILDLAPDAILIYAGHNEFYGALGIASNESLGDNSWLINFYLDLQNVRLIRLLRDIVLGIRSGIYSLLSDTEQRTPSATLMERMVSEQKIIFGNDIYQAGKEQFNDNMNQLLSQAKQHNVDVIISTLVSNVRKQKPFVSIETGAYPAADSIYNLAKEYEEKGDLEQAKQHYYQAKDLDALRFRAPEEFNAIILKLAREFEIPVVPMKKIFEEKSELGIIGDDFIIEHLHPNADGYSIIANAFLATMRENQFIQDVWPPENSLKDKLFYNKYGFTDIDKAYADLRIYVLKGGWPFKPKSAPNTGLKDFVPGSLADSIAIRIWENDDYSLENAHLDLAKFHTANRNFVQAFEEYFALICMTPYNISPYKGAANALIKLNRYAMALDVLYKSLRIKNTFYANKWIGQILLNEQKVNESIYYLNAAFRLNFRDPQVLYNLSGAYMLNNEYDKAWELVNQLHALNPEFPGVTALRNQIGRLKQN